MRASFNESSQNQGQDSLPDAWLDKCVPCRIAVDGESIQSSIFFCSRHFHAETVGFLISRN